MLERQSGLTELLDRNDLPLDEIRRSLLDLEKANRWLGGFNAVRYHLLPWFDQDCRSILDVGCGGGDVLRMITGYAAAMGREYHLAGVDVSSQVIEIAKERCGLFPNISFIKADAAELPFADNSFDVVLSSTFMHHLEPDKVIRTLYEIGRISRKHFLVVDLVRSRVGVRGVWLLSRLLFGRLSRYDGPVSFMRAYSPIELHMLAMQAGVKNYRMYMHGLCRMALVCDKEDERG